MKRKRCYRCERLQKIIKDMHVIMDTWDGMLKGSNAELKVYRQLITPERMDEFMRRRIVHGEMEGDK